MHVVALIPARYESSRFRGKPLADLCGRPMIWWVYSRVRQTQSVQAVYVATDHEKIKTVCDQFHIPCVMTSDRHRTSTERLYEVSQTVAADLYVCVNGDEPLIDPKCIECIIPETLDGFFAANLMTTIDNPVEVVDNTNIKVVTDTSGNAIFMSRSPIPYPKASMKFVYYKHLGVLAYTAEALQFFATTTRGPIETAEDINELRFLEHGKPLRMIPVDADTLSVDTYKDLEYVRGIVQKKLESGELKL